MSKKILVISTSLRANSNSDMLAEAFMDGARQAGHEVEKVSLKDKRMFWYLPRPFTIMR